jgi:hypothetical protein
MTDDFNNFIFCRTTCDCSAETIRVLQECRNRLGGEQKLEDEGKEKSKKTRARYPRFFEAEQLLEEQEAFHGDITVPAKLDLTRAGVGESNMAFYNTPAADQAKSAPIAAANVPAVNPSPIAKH